MTHRNTRSIQFRSFLPNVRIALTTGLTAAAFLAFTTGARAQATDPNAQPAAQTTAPKPTIAVTNQKPAKARKSREEKVVASKDTKKEDKRAIKDNPLLGQDAKLPDKALYDKAEDAIKHGRFDVGRLDLQTLLNTYPDSQFMMRAKLAVADSWYKEGGTAALTQAEQEYKDFITFFPNAPEAAEAQMRIGDIYFRQMDKPDRDYANTIHAEQEYRLMLQQFPESPLVPQARQRLREVQETLASREANIGAFYATHNNYAATIARYQTVVETYPLYSHLDDVLIGLGDSYEDEAKNIRLQPACSAETQAKHTPCLPEAAKGSLLRIYEGEAKTAYEKVVLEHSASPHVEDAKDRLVGMGLPVPTPTAEQIAASEALENSRGQYTLSNRAILMFLNRADTVQAATIGAPPLEDPKLVSAAAVMKREQANFVTSMNPATNTPVRTTPALVPDGASAPAPTASAPPSLQDVPAANAAAGAPVDSSSAARPSAAANRTGVGIEIVQPSADSPAPTSTTFPGTQPAPAAAAAQTNGGIGPVGPDNATPLAPVEKPAPAPVAVNEAAGTKQPPAQLAPVDGKKPKVECDKADESCSRHKKKKGLAKLNPF